MSSLTFFRDPFPAYTPPTSPRPPPNTPNTPTNLSPTPGESIATPPKSVSGSWPTETTRDLESLKPAVLQPILENDVSTAGSQAPLHEARSKSASSRRTVCSRASATKASTKPAIKRTTLISQKPQTRDPIPVVGEQASESAFPNPASHSPRPKRPVKHNSAVRALNDAVQPVAISPATQVQREVQLTNAGGEAASAPQTGAQATEFSQTKPMTVAAATAISDKNLLKVDSRRGVCTVSPAIHKVILCTTEGPSLEEIREMRQRQDTSLPKRLQTQKSTRKTDERLKHGSPAMRSLRVLLSS